MPREEDTEESRDTRRNHGLRGPQARPWKVCLVKKRASVAWPHLAEDGARTRAVPTYDDVTDKDGATYEWWAATCRIAAHT